MKVSQDWLSDWVSVPWRATELGARLTMAGFELEGLAPAAPAFTGVVVAEIIEASPHPQADKLRVCRVTTGRGEPLQIVCGASNARAGLRSALAVSGAVLPGGETIKAARLRGVESNGMLCSAKELGLAENSAGILELPADAPLGVDLRAYLKLDDTVLELNVTPNRGDAMSVRGIAREVAVLSGTALTGPKARATTVHAGPVRSVYLDAPSACPRFGGRLIRGVNNRADTPLWMRERLRRAGVRSISPIVDVTNYVLLDLGQPMHAYDDVRLKGDIRVRMARARESMTLLDGRAVELDADMLVISDSSGAVGAAGIMGGESTAVSADTVDVYLESAYFAPDAVAGRARRLGLQTDASQRFERGVDPTLQEHALERATELICAICGGKAGAINVVEDATQLPPRSPVALRSTQLRRVLGVALDDAGVEAILRALGMSVVRTPTGWTVTPPPHRFDIAIEADLIEEVARISGYEAITEVDASTAQRFAALPEEQPVECSVIDTLAARGYHEIITLAFVDPALQERLFPNTRGLSLANPIASDLSVMRVSLWPGLLRTALENQHRQQSRMRLFEHGARFPVVDGAVREIDSLGALLAGARLPEQWGAGEGSKLATDFYDAKGDLEALLSGSGEAEAFAFEVATLPCLHPGRSARVLRSAAESDARRVGWIGELHPTLARDLGFTHAPILIELDYEAALRVQLPRAGRISRFPQVRRDLAVVVDEGVTLSALRERVTLTASSLLRDFRVFDIYRGPGIEKGRKSVALGLIFQDISRTLTDEDVDRAVASVVSDLRTKLDARIRE
jgi:phenylalanyl-tRNA synthetase beta chain